MATLTDIKAVINKMIAHGDLGQHICFFGGSMPYIYHGKESGREHSDIDVLVDENYMEIIRLLLQTNGLYRENLDSLNLGLDMDYGIKAFIDGVYVEFEPVNFASGIMTRKSFSPDKELAGSEEISYSNIEDIIVPIEMNGVHTFSQSMEMIKAGKEKYKRAKDLKDISFIDQNGIDYEKYLRVKAAMVQAKTTLKTYEALRNSHYNK